MVVKIIKVLFILIIISCKSYGYIKLSTANNLAKKDLEERKLQNLDQKTPIMSTIQLDGGDIIDCLDIDRQPSLDHPLLKNHKVQRRPSVFPPGMKNSFRTETNSESGFSRTEEYCPVGTVPIYRTTKDQMEKAKNVSHQMFHNIGQRSKSSVDYLPTDPNYHQVFLKLNNTQHVRYYGVGGSSSVYNLNVRLDQSSSANIWIESGPSNKPSLLMAGWMVSPPINGDSYPRLFIYWSVDGGDKTGCYDLACKGFVQVHQSIAPKSLIKPVSTIRGKTYEMKFSIYQDSVTGNWWVLVTDQNAMMGYWPKELVPYLAKAATGVAWGGIALAGNDGISPPMGSGEYPDGFYDHAAFFRDVNYLKKGLKKFSPSNEDLVEEFVDKSRCYGLQNDKETGSDYWGYRFSFGGPGGGNNCKH